MPYPDAFVRSVTVNIPAEYYEPEYVTNLDNIPKKSIAALKEEPDFDYAFEKRNGVMFDLLKQICGCEFPEITKIEFDEKTQDVKTSTRKGKDYDCKPQYYQYFAYTAYALLHGDIEKLNWRQPYNGNIQGQDVMYAINKYGIYGLQDKLDTKKVMVSKFAALYARLFNSDTRFQSGLAEPAELKIEERKPPLTYCGDCGTIRKAWDLSGKAYKPGDLEYNDLLARFKRDILKKDFEKHTKEDQERYLRKKGTLKNLHILDL